MEEANTNTTPAPAPDEKTPLLERSGEDQGKRGSAKQKDQAVGVSSAHRLFQHVNKSNCISVCLIVISRYSQLHHISRNV